MYALGWCVGNNPPFVDYGIRLIGLPALSGRDVISACLPFPLAGRPFHRSTPAHSTLSMSHRQVRGDVSFLLRSQGSRLPPEEVQFYTWAEFPQTLQISGSESHTPTRQPTQKNEAHPINMPPKKGMLAKSMIERLIAIDNYCSPLISVHG